MPGELKLGAVVTVGVSLAALLAIGATFMSNASDYVDVEQALAKPDMSLEERLTEAVISKHRLIFTLVRGSAHASELYSYTHAMAGDIFAKLDSAILEMLSGAMAHDNEFATSAVQLARALYFGGGQLASRCETVAAMEAELRSFCTVHLAGARALASRISQTERPPA